MHDAGCPLVRRYAKLARLDAGAPALLTHDRQKTLTRRAVVDRAARTAVVLAPYVAPGQVALLSLPNGPETVSLFLALRAVGATVALADAAAPQHELLAAARAVNARVVLAHSERLTTLPTMPLQQDLVLGPTGLDGTSPVPGAVLFKLTSGSTGTPRAVGVSARQLVADTVQIARTMKLGSQDTTLTAIPLTHSYGIGSCLVLHLLMGAPLVFPTSTLPAVLLESLVQDRIRHFPAVPAMVRAMASLGCPPHLPDLRLCLTAGALLEPADAAGFHAATGVKVHTFYGSSECGGITFDGSHGMIQEPGCVGSAMERVLVEIVDTAGQPVPRGEEGRVRVTSPAVATASVGGDQSDGGISGRTFLTGDLGRLDAQERLTLTGRVGDLINVAGKKVHPEEVRRVLEEVPGVVAAAVVGLADRHRGQVVAAVLAVVPGSAVTVPRVLAHCRLRLAPHKIPRRLALTGELPRNDRGKLPRDAVRALLARTPDQA